MSGDDTTFPKRAIEQLKVRLLEERLGRAFRIAGVGDDDVEFTLLILEVLEAVADNGLDLGVFETNRHARKVLLGKADDGLVDVAKHGLLDAVVLDNFTKDTTVSTTNDKNTLGVGV